MKKKIISILHFEDNPADLLLADSLLSDLKNITCSIQQAIRLSQGLQVLSDHKSDLKIDVILLDLNLPDSRGIATFEAVKKAAGYIPIIIMSGLTDEALALQAVQSGAQDYLIKGQVNTDLLIRSILYSIEREKLMAELQETLKHVKTLEGLLPICCYCKDIRDERGFWAPIEYYIKSHSEMEFSHGICPKCAEKHHPDIYKQQKKK